MSFFNVQWLWGMFDGTFFVFHNSVETLCVSWALSLVECVAVWALKLPVPHTDVLKPTSHKAFLRNYWKPKKLAANNCHKLRSYHHCYLFCKFCIISFQYECNNFYPCKCFSYFPTTDIPSFTITNACSSTSFNSRFK